MYLHTYVNTYLKEEVVAEGLLRNLDAFRQFLPLAAEINGHVLSYSTLARDIGVDVKTVRAYSSKKSISHVRLSIILSCDWICRN